MDLAGRSVALAHWKDNILKRLGTLSHSVNRIWSIAALVHMATKDARVDGWIMPSLTSRTMAVSILKRAIRTMAESSGTAISNLQPLAPLTQVRNSFAGSAGSSTKPYRFSWVLYQALQVFPGYSGFFLWEVDQYGLTLTGPLYGEQFFP